MSSNSSFDYRNSDPWNESIGRGLAERFANVVGKLDDVRTLCDLGCGNGYLSGLLLAKEFQVSGVDSSESGIAMARATYRGRGEFLCADIDVTLPAKLGRDRRFDAVISSDVIEHLYNPRDLFACAGQLLRRDGWLVIGTPYHGYLKNLALSLVDGWDAHHGVHWSGGHIKFFSVRTLSRMMESAGFVVERFEFYGRAPWLWRNMICVARKAL